MSGLTIFQIITMLAALLSTLAAWLTWRRAATWRETDDGRAVNKRITDIEARLIASGVKLEAGEKLEARMLAVEKSMTTFETELRHLASRADMQSLRAEVDSLTQVVRGVDAGITRIESWLVESK